MGIDRARPAYEEGLWREGVERALPYWLTWPELPPLSMLDPGFAFGEAGKIFENPAQKKGHRSVPVAFVVVVSFTVARYTVPQSCRP